MRLFFFQAGRFSFIQLIIYIGSTLSYYALVSQLDLGNVGSIELISQYIFLINQK